MVSSAARTEVCLVHPPAVESLRLSTSSVAPPLGLAYIASALEHAGFHVHLIDAVAAAPDATVSYIKGFLIGLSFEQIVAQLPERAALVGIAVMYTHQWPAVVHLIDRIKHARPELGVVLGGEHVTAMPEFCLATSRADFLVLGEGEETIVELARAVTGPGAAPLAMIDGLAFRDGQDIVVNPRRSRRLAIDAIPRPAWHLFDLGVYHRHRYGGGIWSETVSIPMLATRGCPYQCTYCSSPNMWTTRWVAREPRLVVDEMQYYVETYGARNFPFQDLTAIIKKEWIVEFCREIIDRRLDITWQLPSGTRLEAIDAEVASLLRSSGMKTMAFAPESISEATRHLVKKHMRGEALRRSIEAATHEGLHISIFFVIGFPHDTRSDIAENLPFLDQIAALGVADVSVTFFIAVPGTELFHSLHDAGRLAIDRDYFRHIPDGLNIAPLKSLCPALGRWALCWWKMRIFLRFYRRRRGSAIHALRGLRHGSHQSKLQTAFRHWVGLCWRTLTASLRRAWLPPAEDRALFAGWDDVYRRIRRAKLEQNLTTPFPTDTTELARTSIVPRLEHEHRTAVRVRGSVEAR